MSWASAQVDDEDHGEPAVDSATPPRAWLKAKLLFGRPVQALGCVVTHITHQEARVIAWPGGEMPTRLYLLMPGQAITYEADVVASEGYQFDLRFRRQIEIEGAPWRVSDERLPGNVTLLRWAHSN